MEVEGYRKIRASALPPEQQASLRRLLRHELAELLVRAVHEQPPAIDLDEIEMVLRPEQRVADFDVAADCGTCGTCGTCVTCVTCVTS